MILKNLINSRIVGFSQSFGAQLGFFTKTFEV